MSEKRAALESTLEKLQQERDQLRLKLHLASMDAKDEYERLAGRVDEIKTQYEPVTKAAGDAAENVVAALGIAAEELWHGFGRVRKALRKEE